MTRRNPCWRALSLAERRRLFAHVGVAVFILGVTLVAAAAIIVLNLVADILLLAIDPTVGPSSSVWSSPIEVTAETVDRTGVEMEAMTACAIAALTIYDMCKSADRGMVIGELALWEKTGGRSGTYRRADSVSATVTNVVES